jgi:hypothetical protein
MPIPLLIKDNIPKPFINQTNNTCFNDASFSQMEYTNPGINKWVGGDYILNYMSLQKNIDFSGNTFKNNCQNIKLNSIRYLPSNFQVQNTSNEYIKLSDNNIKLMSGCEFSSNTNPLTGEGCLEGMQNIENENMGAFEKGYLLAFTVLVVGLLYKANYRLN